MDDYGFIIVAGGTGTRMCSDVPKQFLPLGKEGKPVLVHTLRRVLSALPGARIVISLHESEMTRWERIVAEHGLTGTHTVCAGGATRFDSVRNALAYVAGCDPVAVHDGVRPLVSAGLIRRAFAAARLHGTAVPAVSPADSFRIVDGNGDSEPVDRARLRAVQTPQVFSGEILARAYQLPYDPRFTDDAAVVEHAGGHITLIEGDRANIKITSPGDIAVAEALLEAGY